MFDTSKKSWLVLVISVLLTGCSNFIAPLIAPNVARDFTALKSGQYQLDKTHAAVLFKVQHLGLSTYVGRFNRVDATLDFDPNNIEAARLDAVIEIDSLDINDEGLKQDLMGRAWFNQVEYPQARFRTVSVKPLSDESFDFVGELDWRGVKQEMSMQVTFHGGANNILTGKYTLGFSSTGRFNRSDFGMGDLIPLVGDEVVIEAFAEFLRQR